MKKLLVLPLLTAIALTGCPSPGGGGAGGGDLSQTLQGTISGTSYTFVSGYAGTSSGDSTSWTANLYKVSPAAGHHTYDAGAYSINEYPYVYFSIKKASSPQGYTVTTFGASGGMALTAYTGGYNFVAFDSGQLTITKIDTTANTITGTISATTTDNTSTLKGTFTVDIDPASH